MSFQTYHCQKHPKCATNTQRVNQSQKMLLTCINACAQVGRPQHMADAARWYREYLATRAAEKDASRFQIGIPPKLAL